MGSRIPIPKWAKECLKQLRLSYYEKKMRYKLSKMTPGKKMDLRKGINLIGDITAETGLGQSLRILAGMIKTCGIAMDIYQLNLYKNLSHSDTTWEKEITKQARYGINLIHINPAQWAESYVKLGHDILEGRYNIAFWLWELEEFPEEWVPFIDTVDEIWTPSEFIARGIREKTRKKVVTIPYSMNYLSEQTFDRDYFDLPENQFLFLMMYDSISMSERKNPNAVIEAYKTAFQAEKKDVGLIIKINHLQSDKELESLKALLKEYDNIYYLTENMDRKEIESLAAQSDVYVSLHRAEGFGLVLAEAMYYGTPVIATNWSANTEFMDEESGCLVNYEMVTLDKKVGPYKKGSRWASPDTVQAAQFMKILSENKERFEEYRKGSLRKSRQMQGIGERVIAERVKAIYEENSIR